MSNKKELIVGFPLYVGCTLMDFAGATQVFAGASGFKPIWLASQKSISTTEGVSVLADYDFDYHPKIDILFIPGGGSTGVTTTMEDEVYLNFIRKTASKAKWKGSVCTGAFVFAASGELKDCKATTYWSQIPTLKLLSEKFNLVIPECFPRFLHDEKRKIFTGGGISSSIDLALDLVLLIKGKKEAQKTQLFIQYQPGPPVNSGDPSTAPKHILDQVTNEETDFTKQITIAAKKLL